MSSAHSPSRAPQNGQPSGHAKPSSAPKADQPQYENARGCLTLIIIALIGFGAMFASIVWVGRFD